MNISEPLPAFIKAAAACRNIFAMAAFVKQETLCSAYK